jgi:hypothetical protein
LDQRFAKYVPPGVHTDHARRVPAYQLEENYSAAEVCPNGQPVQRPVKKAAAQMAARGSAIAR